jgi:PA14 domain
VPPDRPSTAAGLVTCPDCGELGFRVRYLDDGGNLLRAEHRTNGWLVWLGDRKIHGATVEVTARFRASATGEWRIGLAGAGPFRLFLDGELVLDEVLQPLSDNFVNTSFSRHSARSPAPWPRAMNSTSC